MKCKICGRDYFCAYKEAVQCEMQGIVIPKFFTGTVVVFQEMISGISKGEKLNKNGVVQRALPHKYTDGASHDPHRAPAYYQIRTISPEDKGKTFPQYPFHTVERIFVDNIQILSNVTETRCALCLSKVVIPKKKENYFPFASIELGISDVTMVECKNCYAVFFSDKQLEQTKLLVKNDIEKQGISVASQKEAKKRGYYGEIIEHW